MYDDLVLFQRFFCFCFFGRREVTKAIEEFIDLQLPRIDKGKFVCSCWWPELYLRVFYCTSLEPFLACFCILSFMVYSVETVTEAF